MAAAALLRPVDASAQVAAVADVYTTGTDSVLVVPAPGVLANDLAEDSLGARLVAGPVHGEVLFRSDGSLTYTPPAGYQGRDSLTYVAQILEPIIFVVDSTATTLTVDVDVDFGSLLGSESDRISSSVGGEVVAYLLPGGPPFAEVHLAEMELILQDSLHLEFSTLLGRLLADVSAGGMTISMVESGGSVSASGTAFHQPENAMQLSALLALRGTGSLSAIVPAGDQDLVVDNEADLEGDIRSEAAGERLRLELPVEFTGTYELPDADVDIAVSGTVYASATFEPAVESAETSIRLDVGTVNTSIAGGELPTHTSLHPVYPNPFNPQAVISYRLRSASDVRLSVFDVTGREVRVLVDGGQPAGEYDVVFDAAGLPGAVYFVRLVSDDAIQVRRAVYAK